MLKFAVLLAFVIGALGNSQLLSGNFDNGRIVNGQNAQLGQFPHMASLRIWYVDGWYHLCGGSIITEQWILTAAHCVTDNKPEEIRVFLGTVTVEGDGDVYNSELLIPHADFTRTPIRNDVGLIKLTRTITITANVKPIRMNDKAVPGGVNAVASGFGRISGGGNAKILQFLEQTSWNYADCQNNLNSTNLYELNLCAYNSNGKGMCNGDSGSPLVANNQQIGIASWVRQPCGSGHPDVYVRISDYLFWISLTVYNNGG